MKKVDARGLSCPEPVIRAKNAMESGDKEYEILVDNVVAKRMYPDLQHIRDIRYRQQSRR